MPTKQEYLNATRLQIKIAMMELLGGVCVDCGNKYHFSAMDFDHIVPHLKKDNVGTLITKASQGEPKDFEVLVEEVKKCELRCANCHRFKTWKNKESGGFANRYGYDSQTWPKNRKKPK